MLLIGCGEVGAKHADALTCADGLDLVAIADPSPVVKPPPGVPLVSSWETAMKEYAPDVVVVATPPGSALPAARAAARASAAVLVEKPTAIAPADLEPVEEDRRIFVAFQPHFAPGLAWLLSQCPTARRAAVRLVCRRDRGYYRDWRTRYATAGGILHQQAIHGLALALRLMPQGPIRSSTAVVYRVRQWSESEDRVTATIVFETGAVLTVDARVDSDEPRCHDVALQFDGGQELYVRGRNLEAGLGRPHSAPDDRALRLAMYRALPADGAGPLHPCLFPLSELRRPLEVIDHAYRNARTVHEARTAS
ncbi:Gfo/Idh/MocA family oxidoreductase [Streptomyces sp. AC1-42W]|uniref:Gfo/Idh/MocA family oxidoreductase n=1 Tax=Streptomyces sp. AC1-42W TaxID=2218666 RepID=UPI000DADE5E0|nr:MULTISPECIES: Gfo/Idh/MocA family oxidoreductase [unclassified Streptomyces]PZT77938.1 gfo/Idh/MocA family oxidoreductase [Streptomyces sp. AC1-42W]PZT80301.1 gfo/Idh/MocA family oxidoreductase [Streptomyces sp. AC1-42T]